MSEQLQQLMFYSNSVINKLQERLANELGELSGYPDYRAFFVNSGAEANENALKLASFHTGKKRVVAFRNSFHGRTSAAVEVTDNPALHAPINTNHNVYFADLDIKEVETELAKGDVCAVILEGISGVGGIQVPDEDFLRQLRKLTRRYGVVTDGECPSCGNVSDAAVAGAGLSAYKRNPGTWTDGGTDRAGERGTRTPAV